MAGIKRQGEKKHGHKREREFVEPKLDKMGSLQLLTAIKSGGYVTSVTGGSIIVPVSNVSTKENDASLESTQHEQVDFDTQHQIYY